MTVVLDTNVLIRARSMNHPHGVIFDGFVFGSMHWAVSNTSLTEYREIILQKAGPAAWDSIARLMDLMEETGNLVRVAPSYQFHVVTADPDDNAFTDCAIAAHADYVITEDRHFAPLAGAGYKPQPISPAVFIERYRGVYV